MKKVLASLALLCTVCLNVQCQKAEIHKTDGTVEEIPISDIDSITFSMTNPFNFEKKTVLLNSGYEMPIIGIGTYLLSTAQAEESVYNALKVGMRLIDTADIYGNEVGVGRGIRRAMQDFDIRREDIFVTSKLWTSSFNNADYEVDERLERLGHSSKLDGTRCSVSSAARRDGWWQSSSCGPRRPRRSSTGRCCVSCLPSRHAP